MSRAFKCDFCNNYYENKKDVVNCMSLTNIYYNGDVNIKYTFSDKIYKKAMDIAKGVAILSICPDCYNKIENMIKE